MLLQGLAIAIALWIIFGLKYTDEFKFFYLLFLPMIWIAMRHGIQGATVALAASHVGINAILEWRGLHAITVVEFQMLMLGLAVTGLFLGMTVTTRRAAEERLHQRETELNQAMRLAAAGEMAQAIAHELNQPLVAVANYARAGRAMLEDPARHAALLADTLDKIDREANRAGQVMRRLREFFRGGGLRPETFTAQELVEESLAHVRRRAERQGITIETRFDEQPAPHPRRPGADGHRPAQPAGQRGGIPDRQPDPVARHRDHRRPPMGRIACASASATAARASSRTWNSACSIPSPPARPRAWAWAWPSAAPWWKPTAASSGSTTFARPASASPCRSRRASENPRPPSDRMP
jgi:signal transduction histidine kinase